MADITRRAIKRWLGHGSKTLLHADRLFNDQERQDLADAIAATNTTANLLGRSRIRLRQQAALRRYAPEKFAEWEAFCMEGVNAGKPGPCPSGVKDEPKAGKAAGLTDSGKKKYGPSKAKVDYAPPGEGTINSVARHIMGKGASADKVPSLVGAPDDAKVKVSLRDGNLVAEIDHPDFTAKRIIKQDKKGKAFIENDEFFVKKESQGRGIGSDVFGRQVEQAREAGVSYIKCHAAKENPIDPESPHNGYYTWPRMGYDQDVSDLSPGMASLVRRKFPDADTVLDVMSTKEGRDFWKAKGEDLFDAKFDLTPGSRSLKIHEAYMAEREQRNVGGVAQNAESKKLAGGGEAIDLADWEEAALSAAWERLEPDLHKFAELEKFCREGPNAGKPGPCPGPKKERPAAKAKGKAPSKEETRGLIDQAKAGKLDAAGAKQLADGLSGMTVAELTTIKKEHGIQASGRKAELVAKLADRLKAKSGAGETVQPAKQTPAAPTARPEAKPPRAVTPRQPGESNLAYLARPDTAEAVLTEEIAGLAPPTDYLKLTQERGDLEKRRNELKSQALTKTGKPRALRGKDKDKIQAAQQEYEAVGKKIDATRNLQERTEADVRNDVMEKIGVTVPSKFNATGEVGDKTRGEAEWLSKITNERSLEVKVVELPFARAQYMPTDPVTVKHGLAKRLVVSGDDSPGVVAHEMAHALEDQHPGIGKASREFLAHRVKDEPLTKMSVATGNKEYGDYEMGRKDDFEKTFGSNAYYVGKQYQHGQTEILSMGVEKLYRDPITFAKSDPEYFKFVIGVLHGSIK